MRASIHGHAFQSRVSATRDDRHAGISISAAIAAETRRSRILLGPEPMRTIHMSRMVTGRPRHRRRNDHRGDVTHDVFVGGPSRLLCFDCRGVVSRGRPAQWVRFPRTILGAGASAGFDSRAVFSRSPSSRHKRRGEENAGARSGLWATSSSRSPGHHWHRGWWRCRRSAASHCVECLASVVRDYHCAILWRRDLGRLDLASRSSERTHHGSPHTASHHLTS
jgi:hypothetical protein